MREYWSTLSSSEKILMVLSFFAVVVSFACACFFAGVTVLRIVGAL